MCVFINAEPMHAYTHTHEHTHTHSDGRQAQRLPSTHTHTRRTHTNRLPRIAILPWHAREPGLAVLAFGAHCSWETRNALRTPASRLARRTR